LRCLYDGNDVVSNESIDNKLDVRKDKPRLLNGANFVKIHKKNKDGNCFATTL